MNINEPSRNRPADEGRNNDTNLRDDSAAQPGVSTVSSSDTDDENEDLTDTAADDFTEDDLEDEQADDDLDDDDE